MYSDRKMISSLEPSSSGSASSQYGICVPFMLVFRCCSLPLVIPPTEQKIKMIFVPFRSFCHRQPSIRVFFLYALRITLLMLPRFSLANNCRFVRLNQLLGRKVFFQKNPMLAVTLTFPLIWSKMSQSKLDHPVGN